MVADPTKAQEIRDLRDQIGVLDKADRPEIVFQETSPKKVKVPIYSMIDGEPIMIPSNLLTQTLDKRLPGGNYMFTAHKEQAPEYRLGQLKCFLHPESPERNLLSEIGLASVVCLSGHLANAYSKRMHALHRHKQEWAMFQEHVESEEEEAAINRQERQLEATLALAGRAAGSRETATLPYTCDECGKSFDANSKLTGHRNLAHKS